VSHLGTDHLLWTSADLNIGVTNNFVTREEMHDEQAFESIPEANDEAGELGNGSNVSMPKDKFLTNMSLFFVRLSTQLRIPETTVHTTAEELFNVNALNQMFIKHSVVTALQNGDAGNEVASLVKHAPDENDVLKDCLKNGGILNTSSRRATKVSHSLNYIEPQSLHISGNNKHKGQYYNYIPVKKSLEALLYDSSVLEQCKSVCASRNGIQYCRFH
jgi:hypothetical protein